MSKNISITIISGLLAIFSLSSALNAAPTEVSLVELKKIQEKLQAMNTFSSDFTQTQYRVLRKREVKSTGNATFGRPNLFRWVLKEPNHLEIFYNGSELIQYEPAEKLALRLSTTNEKRKQLEDITAATVNLSVLLDRYREDSAIRDNGMVYLKLSPRSESEISGIHIVIDVTQYFVQEVKLLFKDGQSNTIVFSTPKAVTADSALFAFIPPKDVKINELK